jgi:hypothetical protein
VISRLKWLLGVYERIPRLTKSLFKTTGDGLKIAAEKTSKQTTKSNFFGGQKAKLSGGVKSEVVSKPPSSWTE